eukprot:2043579-Prymnesium_polylepis.1
MGRAAGGALMARARLGEGPPEGLRASECACAASAVSCASDAGGAATGGAGGASQPFGGAASSVPSE